MHVMMDLDELIRFFYGSVDELGKFQAVEAYQMPEAYRRLLAHNNHMTVTVEAYHGCPVDVEVLEAQWAQPIYRRKILLRRTCDRKCVQFGLVWLNTAFLTEQVRQKILDGQIPLGRVLIEHGVLREVFLRELFEIQVGPELAEYFGLSIGDIVYGRTARIDLDGHPALQLLEIVTV